MKIENWIVNQRRKVCMDCDLHKDCPSSRHLFAEASGCPKGLHPTRAEAVTERAWPSNAPRLSGCCDSALNYG